MSLIDDALSAVESGRTVSSSAGYYNQNDVVRVGGRLVVVRRRLVIADDPLEPRHLDEGEVLEAASRRGVAPRCLGRRGDVMVIEHIVGTPLSTFGPDAVWDPPLARAAANVMVRLEDVSPSEVAAREDRSPFEGCANTREFASRCIEWARTRWELRPSALQPWFDHIGMSTKVLDALADSAIGLRDRRFQLCHGDLQPFNILGRPDGTYGWIDWELAVWGDPLWDVALNIQRTRYSSEAEQVLWSARQETSRLLDANDAEDLKVHVAIQCATSLITDSIRYWRRRAEPAFDELAHYLAVKLAAAGPRLGTRVVGASDVADRLGSLSV